jgi:hypothetical protein
MVELYVARYFFSRAVELSYMNDHRSHRYNQTYCSNSTDNDEALSVRGKICLVQDGHQCILTFLCVTLAVAGICRRVLDLFAKLRADGDSDTVLWKVIVSTRGEDLERGAGRLSVRSLRSHRQIAA